MTERVLALDVAITVGTATYDGDGNGRDDLLRVADEQLYAAPGYAALAASSAAASPSTSACARPLE